MRIALVFNKNHQSTTGCYFEKLLAGSPHQVQHFWAERANEINPEFDLYLRIDHGDYKYDIPEHLHPAAFLAIDTHLKKPYKKIEKQAGHYDFVFCAQQQGAERLRRRKKINSYWLPLACDPQLHRKLEVEKKFDLGFVGTDGKQSLRALLLKKLRQRYPASYLGRASHLKMSEIYSAARIGFNYSINNDINMRMFEIMSCATMLLTNRIRKNGFEELFTDKENVVVYRSPRELFKLVDYYLEHPEQRERIAYSGYKLVTSRHSYLDRLKKMFEQIRASDQNRFKDLTI